VTPEAANEGARSESDECPDGGFLAWTQVAGVSSSHELDTLNRPHQETHETDFWSSKILLTSKV